MQDGKVNIFDREGRIYQVNAFEVEGFLASGAYFIKNMETMEIPMPEANKQGMMVIYEIKSGKKYMRRPVDARELVASGEFSLNYPKKAMDSSAIPPNPADLAGIVGEKFPELTAESSKADISAALTKLGVQYRQSMDKADLLQLWQNFLAEQSVSMQEKK